MHGYTVAEITNQPILDVFAPEAQVELPEQIEIAHKIGNYIFESKHIRKDGSIFSVLIDITLFDLRNSDKQRVLITGRTGIFRY
jgi:PAS domain S-box-containing protein